MSQTLLTVSKITKEAMRWFHNNCVAAKIANREWEKEFAVDGNKIGGTVNIRKPNNGAIRTGRNVSVGAITEEYIPLTVGDMIGTDFSFNSSELALSVEQFAKRYLTTRMATLANKVDYDVCSQAKSIYNIVGTPGTTPGTGGGSASGLLQYNSPQVYLNAGVLLDVNAAPRDGRRKAIIDPLANAASVAGLSGLYNDQAAIGQQFMKGRMGYALDLEFGMDQNINTLTLGTRTASGSVAIQANATTGDTSIKTKTGTGTVVVGDRFTIAGVYGVNPENQQSTGLLQQFVCTEAVTLAGSADTIKVSPKIVLAGTGVANGTVTKLPATDDAVTFVGTASTVMRQNLVVHPDCIALAMIDLPLPGGQVQAYRESYDGFSIRTIMYYDGNSDQWITRMDMQYAVACIRPELGCVIAG